MCTREWSIVFELRELYISKQAGAGFNFSREG